MRQQYSLMDLKVNTLIFSLPTSTIVVCDNNRLVADSLIKGIDLCFKLIMVFEVLMDMLLNYLLFIFEQS
jgi:hypothetical protein